MKSRSPLRWTLVLAAAAHAAVAVWAARMPRQSGAAAANDVDLREATIEVEAPPAEPSEPTQPATPSPGAAVRVATASELRPTAAGQATTVGSAEAPPGPSASAQAGAADGTWTFNPTTTPLEPAGSGSLSNTTLDAAMNRGVGAVVRDYVKKRESLAGSRKVFTSHDLALGLVPGGQLVSLARDLVRRSLTPDNGRALLQFDTDGKGVIASVRVLDVSAGRPEWDRVAAQILESARATPLQVPDGASGVSVTLEVTSAIKTVDGSTVTEGSGFSKTVGAIAGAITNPVGTVMDASTRPRRVVAAHIVDVRTF